MSLSDLEGLHFPPLHNHAYPANDHDAHFTENVQEHRRRAMAIDR